MYETVGELLRAINKQKFIKTRTAQIEKEQQTQTGSLIPAFQLAEVEYTNFLSAGSFDINGFLKPLKVN